MATRKSAVIEISDDCEFESYIRSLTTSSDRVRYVLIAVLILTALLFVGYLNSSYQSWMSSRLELAYLAREFGIQDAEGQQGQVTAIEEFLRAPGQPTSMKELGSLVAKVGIAGGWADQRGFRNDDEILAWIQDLHQAEIEHVLQLTVPFLGLRIDVNDLGTFGGLGLTLLMLLLTFSMSREHENVYLALWKVRRLRDAEGEVDKREGRANLLYHALAMAQVLSKPPTLARWQPVWSRISTKILFVLPLLVHVLVFVHDWQTQEVARVINPFRTNLNVVIEAAAFLLLVVLSFACIGYSRSNDVRWSETFFSINPSCGDMKQPGWFLWVRWVRRPQERGNERTEE